jgi:hypothetical protein
VVDILDRDDGDAPESPPPSEIAPSHHESDGDDVIPPTPETELKKGRKRVRKMKDETYMGEDGYMCKYGSASSVVSFNRPVPLAWHLMAESAFGLYGWGLIPARGSGIIGAFMENYAKSMRLCLFACQSLRIAEYIFMKLDMEEFY